MWYFLSIKSLYTFVSLCANMGLETVCLEPLIRNLLYRRTGAVYRTGGQFILHEPKLILEFRRGDVIFIQSAPITHENVLITEGETCYSWHYVYYGRIISLRMVCGR